MILRLLKADPLVRHPAPQLSVPATAARAGVVRGVMRRGVGIRGVVIRDSGAAIQDSGEI